MKTNLKVCFLSVINASKKRNKLTHLTEIVQVEKNFHAPKQRLYRKAIFILTQIEPSEPKGPKYVLFML